MAGDVQLSTKKRRANGEGAIGKHPKGYWWARLRLPGGKRKAFYADTQKEIIRKLDEAKAALRAGATLDGDRATVSQHGQDWLASIQPTVARNTYITYECLLRLHIWPSLGRKNLRLLSTREIQAAYSVLLADGMTPATLGNTHRTFHTCLEKAVQWGLILRNPSGHVDLPKVNRPEKLMLSEQEIREFLAVASGHRLEALFTVALATGARSGELLALRWQDVDLDARVIHIRKSLKKMLHGFEIGDTKTSGSRRDIDLGPRSIQVLREHRARQNREILSLGSAWDESLGLVFANRIGGPLDQTNVLRREFRPLLRLAGLPETIRFHDLRHIFASLALSKGMDVVRVSAMLGHTSPATTLQVYSHALPGHGKPIAAVLDSVITG